MGTGKQRMLWLGVRGCQGEMGRVGTAGSLDRAFDYVRASARRVSGNAVRRLGALRCPGRNFQQLLNRAQKLVYRNQFGDE